MSLIPAIISTVSNLGSNIANSVLGYKAQKSANATNVALAKYQNDWNLAQWNRENEYNHPLNQMKRLGEAGLNPNLVYGNGATTVAARSPSAASAHVDPAAFQIPITAMSQQYLAMEQLRLQEKATAADVALTAARTAGVLSDNQFKARSLDDRVLNERIKQQVNNQVLGQEIQKYTQEANRTNIQAATADAQIEFLKQKPRLAREQMRATFIGLGIRKRQVDAAVAVAESVIRLNGAKVAQMDVETLSKKINTILGAKDLQFYNEIGKSPAEFARDVKYTVAGIGVVGGLVKEIPRVAQKRMR